MHFTPSELHAAIEYLERRNGKCALYAVLNPVRSDIAPGKYVGDEDITSIRWFPLDADPCRAADTASTSEEKLLAIERMNVVVDALVGVVPGIEAAMIRGDSGNGAHALILLPNYPSSEAEGGRSVEVQRLKLLGDAISKRFSTSTVQMDRSIYNPSRIWRVYGCVNVKGADTKERPHRSAAILTPAGKPSPVPIDLLAHWDALRDAFGVPDGASTKAKGMAASAATSLPTTSTIHQAAGCVDLPPWWSESVGIGGRNNAAFRRARWLVNPTEGNRSREQAWTDVVAWNSVCCRPPIGTAELLRTFDSAADGGADSSYTRPATPTSIVRFAAPSTFPVPNVTAFHGLAGDIVRAIEPHTEADATALLIQFLVAFGNVVGRFAHFQAEADLHYGNLFAVLVGVSSKGRKGSSWGQVRRVFEAADPTWVKTRVVSGLSSGEGLIYHVRDPFEKQVQDKKTKEMIPTVEDAGVADKRLAVQESEFASVLRQTRREGNTLSPTVRNAWDTGDLQSLTKNNPNRATGAHISIIGHITQDELRKELAETETANGFGNRFLWVCVKRSKELPDGGRIDTVDFDRLIERLKGAIVHSQSINAVRRDGTAKEIWYSVYHDLSTGKPGLRGAMTGRSEAQTMRLALLYALLDGDDHIRAPHLTAALALWEYCDASVGYIFGDSLGDRVADKILSALRSNTAGLSRDAIREVLGRNESSARIEQALMLLSEHGLAYVELLTADGHGRPTELWKAK